MIEDRHGKKTEQFLRLLRIMDQLREQCPWDKKQTFQSLRYLTIEETYELADSILDNDLESIKKELGDVLLHIVFYSRLGSEQNAFDIADVMESLCEKLIYRHPHIYGDVKATTEEEVKENWEKLKLKEGSKSVLSGVPRSLPALVKATRIQDKAKSVGFDWETRDQVWSKVKEEIAEMQDEIESNHSQKEIESEFGDVLFALINYARFIGVNPEDALERTNKKFIKRFNFIEEQAVLNGKKIDEMSLDEMEAFWNQAKKNQ